MDRRLLAVASAFVWLASCGDDVASSEVEDGEETTEEAGPSDASSGGGTADAGDDGPGSEGGGGATHRGPDAGDTLAARPDGGSPSSGQCLSEGMHCEDAVRMCCPELVCVASDTPDMDGCRPQCTRNDDCDSGCCRPLAGSSDGFCADARFCGCAGVGDACGPPDCCQGSECTFDDAAQTSTSCKPTCERHADCASDCCASVTGKSYSVCVEGDRCG